MFRLTPTAAALCAGLSAASLAQAQQDPAEAAIGARQAHMTLFAHNLGLLGNMARGNTEYDAESAGTAADNLHALAQIDQQGYWPEGTSNEDFPEETRALPAIWEDMEEFRSHQEQLVEAAAGMQEAAGGGIESLQGQMQALGGACGSCHEDFRESDD